MFWFIYPNLSQDALTQYQDIQSIFFSAKRMINYRIASYIYSIYNALDSLECPTYIWNMSKWPGKGLYTFSQFSNLQKLENYLYWKHYISFWSQENEVELINVWLNDYEVLYFVDVYSPRNSPNWKSDLEIQTKPLNAIYLKSQTLVYCVPEWNVWEKGD